MPEAPGLIAWLSSFLLAICAIPAAVQALNTGKSNINMLFLSLWLGGEILGIVEALRLYHLPLFLNYMINLICIIILMLTHDYEVDT